MIEVMQRNQRGEYISCATLQNQANQSIFELLIQANLPIAQSCAGHGVCGQCLVRFLTPPPACTPSEEKYISKAKRDTGWRLACAHTLTGNHRILLPRTAQNPIVLTQTKQNHLPHQTAGDSYGVAVDLGTTTLAFYIYDLQQNACIQKIGVPNPQIPYGRDVVTRIHYAMKNEAAHQTLQNAICSTIGKTIREAFAQDQQALQSLQRVMIAGNTTMIHLLTGHDVEPLAFAPFEPCLLKSQILDAEKLGLPPHTRIQTIPNLSAYIGGDIACGILATGLHRSDTWQILLDIGTNGEMVLGKSNCLIACATAAGPCFEGYALSCGQVASSGAIDTVDLALEPCYTTIHQQPATGICGSGIVDAISQFKLYELIDYTGHWYDIQALNDVHLAKYRQNNAFYFTPDVYVHQSDIHQFQQGKAALAAGLSTLLETANLDYADIDQLHLAGGFGQTLNLVSAAHVGLIPHQLLNKTNQAGNTAGHGCIQCLLNPALCDHIESLRSHLTVVDLNQTPSFQTHFIQEMTV